MVWSGTLNSGGIAQVATMDYSASTLYDESMHHLPLLGCQRTIFPTLQKQEKNHYITPELRSNRGERVGNPQYLTPLIRYSLWHKPRSNLLICPIRAHSESHLTSPCVPESNRRWLAYENPNHWKLLLMWCRYVCLLNNFKMTSECRRFFFFLCLLDLK